MNKIIQQLIQEAIRKNVKTQRQLQILKNKYAKKYGITSKSNIELIKAYNQLVEKGSSQNINFENLLRKRKIRTLSGVAVVAVLTKAYPCPGKCIYCPTEKDMPKSYLSNEPAVMRAILNEFDPYKQVRARLQGLQRNGHKTDKIEIIVIGGTFSCLPKNYQTNFIRQVFNALNYPLKKQRSLEKAQKLNEKSTHRCVALTLETRPDFITPEELKRFRKLGCTKIEIGVQTTFDDILRLNKRGHNTKTTKKAIKLIKDAGFKVCFHMMPNLPGSNLERDYQMFKEIFENPDYKPDFLKIYPCVVTKGSEIKKWWKKGKYKPYTKKELCDLIIKVKKIIPQYTRVIRVIRDIPAPSILAGNKISNLRQILQERKDLKCRCIRCREIKNEKVDPKKVKYKELVYEASGGKEYFLTFEQKGKLCSLLRLRMPLQTNIETMQRLVSTTKTQTHFIKELQNTAIIRDLHTYGKLIQIAKKEKNASQHIGLGKKLIKKAEEIAKKENSSKIAVISGVGVRDYYRKLGYKLEGTYMVKKN